eukprot:2899510-Pleurochrysis_carterae.AAC.1
MKVDVQATLHDFDFTGPPPTGQVWQKKLEEHCRACSFTEFWKYYRFDSAGKVSNTRQLLRRVTPTISV